jgi:hypothetical protein
MLGRHESKPLHEDDADSRPSSVQRATTPRIRKAPFSPMKLRQDLGNLQH